MINCTVNSISALAVIFLEVHFLFPNIDFFSTLENLAACANNKIICKRSLEYKKRVKQYEEKLIIYIKK